MNPLIEFHDVNFGYFTTPKPVFTGLDLAVPPGITTLVGQNGAGKSTFLLLAGARLMPEKGRITITGTDTADLTDEDAKNRLVSFVYQNMEFDTDESVEKLMHAVAENGNLADGEKLIPELIDTLELQACRTRPTTLLSKGEMQRAIIGFSILYGSRILMMDEPVFALQDYQKEKIFAYLTAFCRDRGISLLYSAHERELSRQFSDHLLLFYRNGAISLTEPECLDDRETMEAVYEIPQALLYKKERLYRKHLLETQEMLRK